MELYIKNVDRFKDVIPKIDLDSPGNVSEVEEDLSAEKSITEVNEDTGKDCLTIVYECKECDLTFRSDQKNC